ncbi:MAG: hypothetical protein Q4C45_05930 [Oscillospiraceae bacterium]|nr:hypothetical protein [Oscillospiraceae bacterium]
MQDNSDRRRKRAAPLACAALAVAFLGLFLAALLFLLPDAGGEISVFIILALYAAVVLAMIAGILLALRQRLREIEGGEEEDARKY